MIRQKENKVPNSLPSQAVKNGKNGKNGGRAIARSYLRGTVSMSDIETAVRNALKGRSFKLFPENAATLHSTKKEAEELSMSEMRAAIRKIIKARNGNGNGHKAKKRSTDTL
jgi:DNA-binding NarL/FixJ family response regulator